MEITVSSAHFPAIMMLSHEKLPEGVSVTVPPIIEKRNFPISETWAIAIFQVAASVPTAVVSLFIYDYFKKLLTNSNPKITINRKKINLEHGEIVRVIEETIQIEK